MEVRGSITDRPWGLTLGAIALRRHTGQLVIDSDGKRYCVAFDDGAIVAASSPLAADATVRVALTAHLITSTQVPDLTRKLAALPDRDEVEVLAEAIRFTPEQVLKLRHRVVAQRAARTFSLERGEFVLDDRVAMPVAPGVSIDHRHAIYLGVRNNLSEQRLLDDLRQLGSHFVLKPEALDELPRFGFEASAQPVLDALKAGTSLPELEAAHRELDPRFAQAIIYALVSCTACAVMPRPGGAAPNIGRAATLSASPTASPPSATTPPVPHAARTATLPGGPAPARTEPARASRTSSIRTTSLPATRQDLDTASTDRIPPPPTAPGPPAATTAPLATGTDTYPSTPPARASSNSLGPPPGTRTTTSPFAARTRTASPSAYSGTTAPDAGTNTPAATRAKSASEPPATTRPSARTSSPTPGRSQSPTQTPLAGRPTAPPARGTISPPPSGSIDERSESEGGPTGFAGGAGGKAPRGIDLTSPASPRVDTEETVKFGETPTPLPAVVKQTAVFSESQPVRGSSPTFPPRPSIPRAPTPAELEALRGFADQRTPGVTGIGGFGDQRTPGLSGFGDQRTPGLTGLGGFGDQRTPGLPGFGEQRTPGFSDQRTPGPPFGDQRTPGAGFGDQRTQPGARVPGDTRPPGDPATARTATGNPISSRVTTDNAIAADEAFKRGELAMKRDQPGEAILEFKTALDLNPHDVDYAGMLAWAKFCAAGDKPGIGVETRRALEKAVYKSNHPERARFYLGRVERMLGRDKEALRHFMEVLDIKANHAEAQAEIRAIEARLAAAAKGGGLFGRKK